MRAAILAKSIRWRLQLWLAFLLVAVLSGFGVAVFQLHRLNQFNQIDEELARRLSGLSAALRGRPPFGPGGPAFGREPGRLGPDDGPEPRPPPDRAPDFRGRGERPQMAAGRRDFRLPPGLANAFDQDQTNSFYFVIWMRDGTLLKASTNAPGGLAPPERRSGDTRTYSRTRGTFREAFHFTERGDCILAGHSVVSQLKHLRQFTFWLIAAGGGVLALGCGGGWWLAATAIRPIREISAAARRISAGNLSERIQEPDPDNELGQLAQVLNSTFGRLETAFAQQKQFTADASHELRTPLAVLISEAQTTLARERTAAEYRETVEVCLETAQRMRHLTEALLQLARLEGASDHVRREPIDLAEIVRRCLADIRLIAVQHSVQLDCTLESAPILANPERIAQVITNLLTNAIYYNKQNGRVEVATRITEGSALLTVTDSGQGIGPEDLPHIFERFYRADKSRSSSSGRTGLGLAICKSILDAEAGNITVTSELGQGTRVSVRFSAHYSGARSDV